MTHWLQHNCLTEVENEILVTAISELFLLGFLAFLSMILTNLNGGVTRMDIWLAFEFAHICLFIDGMLRPLLSIWIYRRTRVYFGWNKAQLQFLSHMRHENQNMSTSIHSAAAHTPHNAENLAHSKLTICEFYENFICGFGTLIGICCCDNRKV
jgi:hypothetical protein